MRSAFSLSTKRPLPCAFGRHPHLFVNLAEHRQVAFAFPIVPRERPAPPVTGIVETRETFFD